MIYHFMPEDRWEETGEEYYRPESLDEEGFIHFSGKDQITEVANFKFDTDENILLFRAPEESLEPDIRYEGQEEEFPHVYGPVEIDKLEKIGSLEVENGEFKLPENME